MNIEIGKAAIEDKTRIQEILSIYNMGHFGHSEREAMPKIENFFVAKDQGGIIGCAAFLLNDESELTKHDKQAEIGSLAVLPEYRRQCFGRQLVVTRLLRMAKMGIEIVFMETDAPENIDWYIKKFGFAKLHTRKKTANFCNPAIDTFTLLELDLVHWCQKRRIKANTSDIDVDWYVRGSFGDLADNQAGCKL